MDFFFYEVPSFPEFCPANSSCFGFLRLSNLSPQVWEYTRLCLDPPSLCCGLDPLFWQQAGVIIIGLTLFPLRDHWTSLPDVQCLPKCCFICFIHFFAVVSGRKVNVILDALSWAIKLCVSWYPEVMEVPRGNDSVVRSTRAAEVGDIKKSKGL